MAVPIPPANNNHILQENATRRQPQSDGKSLPAARHKAMHTELDRVVALKVLPMGRLADDRAIARFRREMKAAGRLEHPNIVRAHDAREIDGTHFLVMEYVDGLDLSELVRRLGPLPIADACELVRQAALALQYAHEHGLVHRDIKPSNLMLTRDGRVKVLDLGLARIAADRLAGEEMTDAGQAMGTADYMAPEQVADSHTVDIRADIYSLSCTLYKLLSGHAPFRGPKYKSAFDKMTAHVRERVPPIKDSREDIPHEVVAIVDRMLAKAPAQRYRTPGEVADAVGRFARGSDLSGLWADAQKQRVSSSEQSESCAGTPGYHRSAEVATQPSRAFRSHPSPISAVRRWKPLKIALGLMLFGLTAGLALEIIIRIIKDGRETTIRVPEGREITIDFDGKGRTRITPRPRPGKEVLFQEDFAGRGPDLPKGWSTTRGSWKVQNGVLAVHMSQPYYPGFAFAPAAAWRDYAVECEMRHDQAVAGIVFRHNEQDRFYALVVRHEESETTRKYSRDFPVVEFAKWAPGLSEADRKLARKQGYDGPLYGGPVIAQREYVLTRGKYHHVRVEIVGNTMSAFIDGKLVLNAEDRKDVLWSGSVGFASADACFKPGITSFRNLRVQSLGNLTRAAWEFDEGQGVTAQDSSGNGNRATMKGGVRWVDGRDGKAVALDGSGAFIQVPDGPSQSGMKRLTIRVLFKLHSLPKQEAAIVRKWGRLVDARDIEDDSFILSVSSNGQLNFLAQNRFALGRWVVRSRPIPLDKWIEAVAVYDGLRNTLYTRIENRRWTKYEGFQMPTKVQGFEIRDTDEPIEIGRSPWPDSFLNAAIDWIRIYAEANPPKLETE